MNIYSKIKTLSKILMYFSLFAVTVVGGIYFLYRNQITADPIGPDIEPTIIGGPITITMQESVPINEQFTIKIKTNPALILIDHVSLFIQRADIVFSITKESICQQANLPNHKDNCILCLHGKKDCQDGVCDVSITTKLSQKGSHKVVVVAVALPTYVEDGVYIRCNPEADPLSEYHPNILFKAIDFSKSIEAKEAINGGDDDDDNGATGSTRTPAAIESFRLNLNPGKITSTELLITTILDISLLLLGGLSVIAIIISGLYYISSAGNPDNAEKGKKALVYAVAGIVIVVLAYIIEKSIIDLIDKFF